MIFFTKWLQAHIADSLERLWQFLEFILYIDILWQPGNSWFLIKLETYFNFQTSRSLLLATFSTWKIVLWLSFPIFYGVVWGAGSYFLCAPSEYTTEFVRENILNNFNLQMEDIAYFGLNFYGTDNNGKQFIVYEQVVGIVVNSFIIVSSKNWRGSKIVLDHDEINWGVLYSAFLEFFWFFRDWYCIFWLAR